MRVLVLGSGGREHALAWKIKQSAGCQQVFLHPGNAGTRAAGIESLPETSGIDSVIEQAKKYGIHLIVIGPEALLAQGYGDKLRAAGFLVVGPDQFAAQLETSKIFSKEFMARAKIPTAPFRILNSEAEVRAVHSFPIVLKLDGLAAGKGVVIAETARDVERFADRIWKDQEFGPGTHRVLAESVLRGREVSLIGLCDGQDFIPLSSATDYKRIGDGHQGPNTGGMGAVSPSPFLTEPLLLRIRREVVDPVLQQFQKEKIAFRGVLFIGLMIDDQEAPHVLEFNTRFGDPETQAILLRLESDFVHLLQSTAAGKLSELEPVQWSPDRSLYVVAAAEGYPATPRTGDIIKLPQPVPAGVTLFFSGVAEKEGHLVTQGGRVLGLGTKQSTVDDCRKAIYGALEQVHWHGMQFRKDIGH